MIEKSPDVSTLTDDGKRFANRGHHGDPQLHSRAKNIFWQVAGQVEVGPGADLESGVVWSRRTLCVLAQTAFDLQQAVISQA
jgi:hypothetical protein